MEKLKSVLAQWSTLRGFLLLVASVAGVNPLVSAAGAEVLDVVVGAAPAVTTAVIGLYDVVRDDRKQGRAANAQ